MKMNGAEILIHNLEHHGIGIIAGIPGGSNLPIYQALAGSSIRHILARHEQGAGFIAQGMARSTGKVAVCLSTSGPGATNLLTALADAKSDSVPVIAITGQVATSMIGTDAFQETDICAMATPVVKKAFQIRSASEITEVVDQAFTLASKGRPGPILIDIPKDIQLQESVWMEPKDTTQETAKRSGVIPNRDMEELARMIHRSERPVFYVGGGIIKSNAGDDLRKIAEKNNIPVVTTLMGLGCFPSDHPLNLGMPGMHGSRSTNMLMHEADLLLAFGVRFDDRVTGKVKEFCPDAKVAHIDIDPKEIGKIRQPDFSIQADCRRILEQLDDFLDHDDRLNWLAQIDQIKRKFSIGLPDDKNIFHPINFIRAVRSFSDDDTIITTDVGQHQMWVAQHYGFEKPRTFLTSGGLGTMGFGLPAAIGAALANPDKRVISICGDGSLLMNIQELATLADVRANLHVLVMNNGQLGLVRQQQELFYEQKYVGSNFETKVDFTAAARAFGIHAYDLNMSSRPAELLERALKEPGPCLINVPLDNELNVYPMVPPGAANLQMIGS